MKSLEHKVVVITGAAMGLGLATAREAAAQGAMLSLVDYNEKALGEAKENILKEYPQMKIITVVADVSKEADVKNYVNATMKEFNRIDAFYNNAGVEGRQALMADYDI